MVGGIAQQYPQLFSAIQSVRMSMVSDDALRSFLIVAAGACCIFLFFTKKIDLKVMFVLITVIILGDLYSVNKRYLDTDSFVARRLPMTSRSPSLPPTVRYSPTPL